MSNEPSVSITLRIPASLHDELRALAEAEDRSIASIFRQAARSYLDVHRPQVSAAAWEALPEDERRRRVDRLVESGSRYRGVTIVPSPPPVDPPQPAQSTMNLLESAERPG